MGDAARVDGRGQVQNLFSMPARTRASADGESPRDSAASGQSSAVGGPGQACGVSPRSNATTLIASARSLPPRPMSALAIVDLPLPDGPMKIVARCWRSTCDPRSARVERCKKSGPRHAANARGSSRNRALSSELVRGASTTMLCPSRTRHRMPAISVNSMIPSLALPANPTPRVVTPASVDGTAPRTTRIWAPAGSKGHCGIQSSGNSHAKFSPNARYRNWPAGMVTARGQVRV